MNDYWELKIKKYKDSTGNWQTTISGGYLDIVGKVYPMIRYKESDYIQDSSGNNTTQIVNNGYWKVNAELTGLINPFINPITNNEVNETKIEASFEDDFGWDLTTEPIIYSKYLVMGVSEVIQKKYKDLFGVDIILSNTLIKSEDTPIGSTSSITNSQNNDDFKKITEISSTPGTSSTVINNITEPIIYGDITFNVEDELTFKGSIEFGTLEIIGKGIIKEEIEESIEGLDSEYTESFSNL